MWRRRSTLCLFDMARIGKALDNPRQPTPPRRHPCNNAVTGLLDPATRRAIAEWQKSRGAALSSYLGPMQLAELREESEDAYQNLVAAQSAPKPKAAENVKPAPRAARPRAAVWAPKCERRWFMSERQGSRRRPRAGIGPDARLCLAPKYRNRPPPPARIAMAVPHGAGKPVCLSTVGRLRSVGRMGGRGLTWRPGLSSGRLNRCTFDHDSGAHIFPECTRSFIGPEFASVLWSEGLSRHFDNRRQVAAYAGLASTPWQSGSVDREQGISRSGNPLLRTTMIYLAWHWIRHQPVAAIRHKSVAFPYCHAI